MCGCSGGAPFTGDCVDYTKEDFETYQASYQCVKDNNLYGQAGMTVLYVQDKIDLLGNMIADKELSATSCNYRAYIAGITIDVQNIAEKTDC